MSSALIRICSRISEGPSRSAFIAIGADACSHKGSGKIIVCQWILYLQQILPHFDGFKIVSSCNLVVGAWRHYVGLRFVRISNAVTPCIWFYWIRASIALESNTTGAPLCLGTETLVTSINKSCFLLPRNYAAGMFVLVNSSSFWMYYTPSSYPAYGNIVHSTW